jgi:uncharacterized cupredoxin-like copper-binding protein
MQVTYSKTLASVATAAALTLSGTALAAGAHQDSHGDTDARKPAHEHPDTLTFGEPGEASKADRTIEIVMGDNYFEPESLTIQAGETVRFVIRNEGEFLHEFNIGTGDLHAAHQKEMMDMMENGMMTPTGMNHDMSSMDHSTMDMSGQAHDDPNSVLVEPGKTQELVWKFAATTGLEFACNVPGHYESGMMGEFKFVKPGAADS